MRLSEIEAGLADISEDDAEGMPHGPRRRGDPVFLRIGTWDPASPRSKNWARGRTEKGLSVYALDANGEIIVPDGEWAATDLRSRLRQSEHASFLVQGRLLKAPGHDGEPLLAKPVVVGLWTPPEHSNWAVYVRRETHAER